MANKFAFTGLGEAEKGRVVAKHFRSEHTFIYMGPDFISCFFSLCIFFFFLLCLRHKVTQLSVTVHAAQEDGRKNGELPYHA